MNKFPLHGIRILLVESEVKTRELFINIFESAGAEVIATHSIQQAVDVLDCVIPDLVVSNLFLVDGEGCFIACYIQRLAIEVQHPIPTIAISAAVRITEQERSLAADFWLHLTTPIEPDQLVAQAVRFHPHKLQRSFTQ